MVIWLVGMSGVGKTTIADILFKKISKETDSNALPIDGDIVRLIDGNNKKDTSYSLKSRYKNAKRIQEICLALDQSGEDVICSILCIFPDILKENKKIFSNYYEVYLDASLEELERRDTKGLYESARKGLISDLVGYDIEFPIPKEPNIHLKTDQNKTAKELASIIYNEIFDDLNLGNKDTDLKSSLSKATNTTDYAAIVSKLIKPAGG
jgi:adenylylsulfate kinase-like enzyme